MNKCTQCLHEKTTSCNLCLEHDLYKPKYHFFWRGPFSQWTKRPMIDPISRIEFNCCEQYMMYKKAMLFNDQEIVSKILCTSNPREQKAYGRQVRNYDQKTWDAVKFDIVFMGNALKVAQNEDIRIALIDTGDQILVEASPYDTIWGIGLTEEEAKHLDPKDWKGLNLLGQVLTSVKQLYK